MYRFALVFLLSAIGSAACSDPQCASGERKIADMCYPDKQDTVDDVAVGEERDDASARSNARLDASKSPPDERSNGEPELHSDAAVLDRPSTPEAGPPSLADGAAPPISGEAKDAGVDTVPVEVDPCAPVNGATPCAPNATCTVAGGKPVCACPAAYVGDGKTCSFDSSCSQLKCDKNAECVVTGSDTRECRCRTGFMGSGTSCSNTNECASSPCAANADCKDTEGSYECSCKEGYEKSGNTCAEIDECKTSPCSRGRCVDQVGTRTCDCAGTGYHGERCEIDDCSTLSCAPGTRCENVSGSARCVVLCGNKKVDQGEQCDWSAAGELPGYSCTSDCQKISFLTSCSSSAQCQGGTSCVSLGMGKTWCAKPCSTSTVSCPALPEIGGIPSCGTLTNIANGENVTACIYRCQSDADCPSHFFCTPYLTCDPR